MHLNLHLKLCLQSSFSLLGAIFWKLTIFFTVLSIYFQSSLIVQFKFNHDKRVVQQIKSYASAGFLFWQSNNGYCVGCGFLSPLFLFKFHWGDTVYAIHRIVRILAQDQQCGSNLQVYVLKEFNSKLIGRKTFSLHLPLYRIAWFISASECFNIQYISINF